MDGVNSREVCQRKVRVINLSLNQSCHCFNEQCAKFNLDQKKDKCLYYNWKEVGWINGRLLFSYLNLLETIRIILSLHPVHLFAVCGLAVKTLLAVFKLVWFSRDIPLLLRRGPGVLHLWLLCHARTLKRQPHQD